MSLFAGFFFSIISFISMEEIEKAALGFINKSKNPALEGWPAGLRAPMIIRKGGEFSSFIVVRGEWNLLRVEY